ncbi:unnamed protein product [Arctia plantaginis]|uniref:Uncharacterized protein n=1 Tax=Arctia plantaginis TaxID=874455 RepID=A0A8S1AGW1_ARCPL|nr:unnamed protein product [Arctia plantaginis]
MSLQKSVKSGGGDRSDLGDTTSICSSVTTQPDRHGFFGGAQYSPEPQTLLGEIAHARRPVGRPKLRFKENVKRDVISFDINFSN